jgi:hypothetical protein
MIFDELKKGSTVDLYFRDIQNTLLDRKLKSKFKNKILKLKKLKTVLKTLR